VRVDGRLVGGKGWRERVYNREKTKKFLRMARNFRILHMLWNEWADFSLNSLLSSSVRKDYDISSS
jgi:hypothetical protein